MKVFLSSTAEDLSEYRRVADDTILRLSQESIAMERFGPHPGTPLEECERMARESDVVVCIVAHRYGSIPEGADASFTHREVEAAHKAGKKVLAWIVEDKHPWTETTEQDLFIDSTVLGNPAREAEVKERIRKLLEFKAWLRKTVISESFTTAEDLGRKIAIALHKHIPQQPTQSVPQDKISIARLPTTSSNLFGREAELKMLDDAWANPNTNIVSFVAWGGVGKTALVNHWLKQHIARDNYRGAERVLGWSFFSQGTSKRAASADLFLDWALRWFGDADPTLGSPWDKGERLARYIRQWRTLLILDGVEPLQYPPGPHEGRLKDPAMHVLLVELAAQNPGLCLISTRERIGDLVEFDRTTVVQYDLNYLSPQAGAKILRSFSVKGEDQELEEATVELGGHAFALTLLGSYLEEVMNGEIQRRHEIENLFNDTRYGSAAQRMIATYETWLGEGMELAILRLLGLFDRPADLASISALREPPAISGLTEPLQQFKGREWNQAVAKLRRLKLLAEGSPGEPGTLDAHPLVREHFKQQLKDHRPAAWRKANQRLYEHLAKSTKRFPETLEEMAPLYAAIAHGCAAGKSLEVLRELYEPRIERGTTYFSHHTLGAYGADLVALAEFFDRPWDLPVGPLPDAWKGFVLNVAGFDLQSLGRLHEAVEPLKASLAIAITLNNPSHASRIVINLADLYIATGDLTDAYDVLHQGIEFADRSGKRVSQAVCRYLLADVLHRQGLIDKAADTFHNAREFEAEENLKVDQYDSWEFMNCEFLLTLGEVELVKKRANKLLQLSKRQNWLTHIGLSYVLLARASLLSKTPGDEVTKAANEAVYWLRQAGRIDRLPLGLLVRASLYRHNAEFGPAERDLEEVHRIAERSGMRLYLADYHLESARLLLLQDLRDKACEHLATGKELIARVGYHLRDKEVQELEAQLG